MFAKLNLRSLATSVSLAALTLGVAFAQPDQKASAQEVEPSIIGAGATSIEDLVDDFFTKQGADYDITGSGIGRRQFLDGDTDFVSTDVPEGQTLKDVFAGTDFNIDDVVYVSPVSITVAFAYRIDGFDDQLTLSVDQACGIIKGTITNWNQIIEDGPDLPIKRVFRTDSSSTTDAIDAGFIQPLCGFSISNPDGTANLPNPNGNEIGGFFSEGVLDAIQDDDNNGAIGYVETALAINRSIPIAVNDESGESTLAASTNYIIFRKFYDTQETVDHAQAVCRYVASDDARANAQQLNYQVENADPAVCDQIELDVVVDSELSN